MSDKRKKSLIFRLIGRMLPVFLLAGFFLHPAQPASAFGRSQTNDYVIKLLSAKDYSRLLSVGQQISHRFLATQDAQFENIYTFKSTQSLAGLQAELLGHFSYLQPQQQVKEAGIVVNDPGFGSDAQDIDKEWGLAKAGFDSAWVKTTGLNSNIVAVIDTGVDATHADLQSINFVPGYDFVNNKSIMPGTNSDDNGHGTLVAGVLGATANNNMGVVGTNWQISVMPIKSLDSTGKGDVTVLSEGIVWAADHGAQFINLSVGGVGFGHDTTLASAITYAFNKNIVIVAAAGNDIASTGQSLDENPIFPICDDNNYNMVIGVAATDQNDLKADFSNYGKNCIDVDAPGKRILSTINFDPLTQKPSPNSYAYASGTSLAVPFVVGQAALIKSLYPTATNIQIRDRIISTADPIDDLNLSQCGGNSCRGLLGAGRIDVPKSLGGAIAQNFSEGDLVKVQDLDGVIYEISGGQKRLVSPFVFNQRFPGLSLKTTTSSQLSSYPEGPYVTPNDNTLVKLDSSPTVYIMENGKKFPITARVFQQRGLQNNTINTLSFSELNSWTTGPFFSPVEGTLIRGVKNPTVYWVVGQVLRPVNYNFYVSRGLNIFPILTVPDNDISSYSRGDAYIS